MNNFDEVYYLPRTGRYSSPENTNDLLPIVYGDLTDGDAGIWILPKINVASNVYCFAGHECLSVANGNSITIYEDGVTINPANYTFSHSNNYESLGVISTITFSTPPTENAQITAQGKGKPLTSGSATLMTNIIDILYNFLVTVSGVLVDTEFDNTYKVKSYNFFNDQSYVAAGIINEDTSYWDTIYKMVSSFKGEAFVDVNNKFIVKLGTGQLNGVADIIGKGDTKFASSVLRRTNIINRVPSNYRYNYVDGEFKSHTDADANTDAASIGIYGERSLSEPYQFYFTRSITTVNKIQGLIVTAQKSQSTVWEITFIDMSLKRAHLDLGDVIVANFDLLFDSSGNPLKNEMLKILEMSTDLNSSNVTFRCLDTGYSLTFSYLYNGVKDSMGTPLLYDGTWLYGGDRDLTEY